jgi:hypothetical protein
MTTTTPLVPDVPLPPGSETYTGWEHDSDGTHRFVWGIARQVDATQISILPHALQLADGSIDTSDESAPGVCIDQIRDGKVVDCLDVTVPGARSLAQALLQAADVVEGWAAR